MALTRLGYLVILTIIATAAAAITFVLWPDGSTSDSVLTRTPIASASATAGPAANPTIPLYPALEFERVIPFVRLGAVTNIDATDPEQVLVNFRPDFDTSGFGTSAHTFETTPPDGRTVEQALQDAGIPINRVGGVDVIRR